MEHKFTSNSNANRRHVIEREPWQRLEIRNESAMSYQMKNTCTQTLKISISLFQLTAFQNKTRLISDLGLTMFHFRLFKSHRLLSLLSQPLSARAKHQCFLAIWQQ